MSQDVAGRVRQQLTRNFPDRAEEIAALGAGDSLFERGLLDSLSFLELVQFLESEFSITVPPRDYAPSRLDSLERIAAYVEQARGG